jgi:hypothetical protein
VHATIPCPALLYYSPHERHTRHSHTCRHHHSLLRRSSACLSRSATGLQQESMCSLGHTPTMMSHHAVSATAITPCRLPRGTNERGRDKKALPLDQHMEPPSRPPQGH